MSFRNVSFAYDDGVTVLHGASLDVPAGTRVGITGETGAGKTTLAEAIRALLPKSLCVKLGHGEEKEVMDNLFYHAGKPFGDIVAGVRGLALSPDGLQLYAAAESAGAVAVFAVVADGIEFLAAVDGALAVRLTDRPDGPP